MSKLQIHSNAISFWRGTFARDSSNRWLHHRRIGALDMGTWKIGVAFSDECQQHALPWGVIHINRDPFKSRPRLDHNGLLLAQHLKHTPVAGWVVGWPLMLDGSAGVQANRTIALLQRLQMLLKIDFDNLLLHDERYTSILAQGDHLHYPNMQEDALAATRILQEYLDLAGRTFVTIQ